MLASIAELFKKKSLKQKLESNDKMLYNKNTTWTTYGKNDSSYSPNTTWKLMWKE